MKIVGTLLGLVALVFIGAWVSWLTWGWVAPEMGLDTPRYVTWVKVSTVTVTIFALKGFFTGLLKAVNNEH